MQKMFFTNLYRIVEAGSKQPFKFYMLFRHPKSLSYEGDYKNFEKFFQERISGLRKSGKKINFLDLIFDYLGSNYNIGAFFSGFRLLVDVFFPILLKQLLNWLQDKNAPVSTGYLWGLALVMVVVVKSFFALWAYYYLEFTIQIIQNVIRAQIIHQISKLSPGSRKHIDAAKATNYLMVDVSKITWYALFKPDPLYNPLLVVALFILCIFEISWVTALMVVIVLIG